MNNFNFWQKFLFTFSILIVIMGIFISLFTSTSIFDIAVNNNINPMFHINGNLNPGTLQFQSWIYGVLGATLSSWGILLAFIFYYPFKEKQKWSWNSILIGVSVWFVLDTTISIYFNVYLNAIANFIFFLGITVPLYNTRKYFR